MVHIQNVQVYRQAADGKVNYMMFLEYKGLRFAKPWSIAKDAKIEPADVAQMFCADAQEELEDNWDNLKYVGEPVEYDLPEWVAEWEKFEP